MVQKIFRFIANSKAFNNCIVIVILLSCVLVALDTSGINIHQSYIDIIDKILILLFAVEAIIKIAAEGRTPSKYFSNPWNVFDFIITIVCVFSLIPALAAFGIVRVLRVFRLFSAIPKLQLWVGALLRSLPAISYVFLLLLIIFFMYGAMGVYLFADNDPFHFGNIQNAILSLFRVITLEDWTDIMYHNINGAHAYPESVYSLNVPNITPKHPEAMGFKAVLYFVSFVLLSVFIILNMFTGIVLSAIQEMKAELDQESMRKSIEKIIGDKEEVKNDLPRVTPDDFEILTKQLNDIQNKLLEFRNEMLKNK